MRYKHTKEDYEFMNSLNCAMIEQTPKKSRLVIYFWFLSVSLFIAWATLTEIDEITRGSGEVVPSGKNQMIQNFDGGILKEIFVKIGDIVEKDQSLLQIDNIQSKSEKESTEIQLFALEAQIVRLTAESKGKKFRNPTRSKIPRTLIKNEKELYLSRQRQYRIGIQVLVEQRKQKEEEIKELRARIKSIKKSEQLIKKEVKMMRPMVRQGIKSRVSFMKLQREANNIVQDLNSAKLTIPKIQASIREIKNKIMESKSEFQNISKEKLNEVVAEVMRIKESFNALDDQNSRRLVKSPIRGVIQELFVNTLGGVVKPGDNLVEIVPTDEAALWMEVKIKPSDIAFIYPNQEAIVKISAYDFAIYGSLRGRVVHISADTIVDKKDNTFYTIHIKTDKNYLGSDSKPLKIIPGMTVDIDIMTGKKSIMDYILKPILKAKQYTFTER